MGRSRSLVRLASALRGAAANAGAGAAVARTCAATEARGATQLATRGVQLRCAAASTCVATPLVRLQGAPALPIGARGISLDALRPSDKFAPRHNSLTAEEMEEMAGVCGFPSVSALVDATVPSGIRRRDGMPLSPGGAEGETESEFLARMRRAADQNVLARNFLGQGYYGTLTPSVILRNVLENPGWYTQYTPYQAEIAQGRLEALLVFQTAVSDLTGLPLAGASLLDEGTAAAEAMAMCSAMSRGKKRRFLIADSCHPQTVAVCETRAQGLGLSAEVSDPSTWDLSLAEASQSVCGVLVQYPGTDGRVADYAELCRQAHAAGVKVVAATDLLALTQLTPPGEWGADVAVGSAQRLGVPLGFGGPHAGFLACREEHKRLLPGRVIGQSRDSSGRPALRMAMQTREQHIRRDKATSNICTAQALLANVSALYAVYHGPRGLDRVARRAAGMAALVASAARELAGLSALEGAFFDTVALRVEDARRVAEIGHAKSVNVRVLDDRTVGVACDETTTLADVEALLAVLVEGAGRGPCEGLRSRLEAIAEAMPDPLDRLPASLRRSSPYLQHPVFNSYHTEHELLRYLKRLENRDLSLAHSMIPLGSCTMKLNATSEMMPITWPQLADVHPFAPASQTRGYRQLVADLSAQLASVTGFDAVSLQPNSGAAGEYAGLLTIRAWHRARGQGHRDVCLIPVSAHGTNPASAALAGMRIVALPVDAQGSVVMEALEAAAEEHKNDLAALMVTYPSTHGVYEDEIVRVCEIVHAAGGQVYMDGANMNAQVGLTAPGIIGADVCHLNLHKTFCIPHGGGGPGVGPIGVRAHLAPHLPTHPLLLERGEGARRGEACGTVSAAPWGSALILPISHAYVSMMGSEGLRRASETAILAANYMATRLEGAYDRLFRGPRGTCAHEFILDIRPLTAATGLGPEDIAKRLMDFGFHAPTMSWPVPGTLMIEPTESESRAELDRYVEALLCIRAEIAAVERGEQPKGDNVVARAPHTAQEAVAEAWDRPYSREQAVYPLSWVRERKFWPHVGRVDNVFGDRTLVARLQ